MTQEEIKRNAAAVKARIQELRDEICIERAKLNVFQVACKHPNRFDTCVMGDNGWRCPDCKAGR